MKYPDDMDKECIRLCDAMNSFRGIRTNDSCCGHGARTFAIHFRVTGDYNKNLPPLLYYFDGCHTRVSGWRVEVYTDCSAIGVSFMATAKSVGEEAYEEANRIAERMEAR